MPRSRCPVPICCGASPGPTTPCWAICQARLECTTSTITLTGYKCLAWVIYRYDFPLFFANATDLVDRALRAVDHAEPSARWFVLDAEANINLDLTAADALEELRARLADRGVIFATTHLRSELRAALSRTGWVDRVGADHLFATLPTAVAAYEQWLSDHPAAAATDDQAPLVPQDHSPEE